MSLMIRTANALFNFLDKLKCIDFLGPLALRIYLAPIFIFAGLNKYQHFDNVVAWFGDSDWGLGLPFPGFLAFCAMATEIVGGFALLFGFALRLFALPMMFTMIVAATTAHWDKGWHALPEGELTVPWEWRNDLIAEGQSRKAEVQALAKEYGDYSALTSAGSITILKNGIEFAATYFIMLLILFFTGAGSYFSLDYWIAKRYRRKF